MEVGLKGLTLANSFLFLSFPPGTSPSVPSNDTQRPADGAVAHFPLKYLSLSPNSFRGLNKMAGKAVSTEGLLSNSFMAFTLFVGGE